MSIRSIHAAIVIVLLSGRASAQISVTSADQTALHAVGNVVTTHRDTSITSVDIGSPGAASWDFSALQSHKSSASTSISPSSGPYFLSDFPTANVGSSYRNSVNWIAGDGWAYSLQSASEYRQLGTVVKTINGSDTTYIFDRHSPGQIDMPLPLTFHSQWASAIYRLSLRPLHLRHRLCRLADNPYGDGAGRRVWSDDHARRRDCASSPAAQG